MKTVLILIVSLFFRNFYGVNPPKKKSIYQSTEKTIQSLFKFPQVLIHKNQESEKVCILVNQNFLVRHTRV